MRTLRHIARGALFEDGRGDAYRAAGKDILADARARVKLSWMRDRRPVSIEWFLSSFDPKRQGVIVVSGGARATFLPEVFGPEVPRERILDDLNRKAGIMEPRGGSLFVYETDVMTASMFDIVMAGVVDSGSDLASRFISVVSMHTDPSTAIPPYTADLGDESPGARRHEEDTVRNASTLASALDPSVMALVVVVEDRKRIPTRQQLVDTFHPTLRKFITTYLLPDPASDQALSFVVRGLVCPILMAKVRSRLQRAIDSWRSIKDQEFALPEIAIGYCIARGNADAQVRAVLSHKLAHFPASIFDLNWTTQLASCVMLRAASSVPASAFERLESLWLEMGRVEDDDPVNVKCVKFEGLSYMLAAPSHPAALRSLWMKAALAVCVSRMLLAGGSVRLDLVGHVLSGIHAASSSLHSSRLRDLT
jgi:hypothetical protein